MPYFILIAEQQNIKGIEDAEMTTINYKAEFKNKTGYRTCCFIQVPKQQNIFQNEKVENVTKKIKKFEFANVNV
jgi:hypothetical protein